MRPRARRRLLVPAAVVGAAVAVAAVGVAQAADAPDAPVARARGLAIEVRMPGVPGIDGGYVETRSGLARSGGPYALPGAPQTAYAGNTESLVEASPAATASTATATARLAQVSLLGGLVRADGVAARAVADARDGTAQAGIATQVTGLVIDGQPIADGVNQVHVIPGVGDVVVGEQVDALKDPLAARSYAIALHVHLDQAYAGLPAGSEIVVGYVDAGAAAPLPVPPAAPAASTATAPATSVPEANPSDTANTPPSPADAASAIVDADPLAGSPAAATGATATTPAAGASTTGTTGGAGTDAARTGAQPSSTTREPAADQTLGSIPNGDRFEVADATVSASRDTTDTQNPPAGGFTKSPPVSAQDHAYLLSGAYDFPVFNGADYSDDFGGARAGVAGGFHQGIDLFGSRGRAIVAVHDGTVFRVGWNTLGGNRLWLDDGKGNLFYYAHMQGYAAKLGPLIGNLERGIAVRRGEVIGYLGDTGQAKGTPPHLHFEIHPNGHWGIPPMQYVTFWEKGSTSTRTVTGADPGTAPTAEPGQPAATGGAVDQAPAATAPASQDIGDVSGLDADARRTAAGG